MSKTAARQSVEGEFKFSFAANITEKQLQKSLTRLNSNQSVSPTVQAISEDISPTDVAGPLDMDGNTKSLMQVRNDYAEIPKDPGTPKRFDRI